MDKKEVIEELKALLDGFKKEYQISVICIEEAIKLLEN